MPPRPLPPASGGAVRRPDGRAHHGAIPRRRGFAVVMALLLVSFLVLLLASLSVLTRVETSAASEARQLALARAQARFALAVAIGELQKHAGPDRRATATGDILKPNASAFLPNPHWTGVWTTIDTATLADRRNFPTATRADAPAWLISGNEGLRPGDPSYLRPDRTLPAGTATVPLLQAPAEPPGWTPAQPANRPEAHIHAPLQTVTPSRPDAPHGRYAWWVGDEGVKATFNVAEPSGLAAADRYASPSRTGLAALPGFSDYKPTDPGFASLLRRLGDRADSALLSSSLPAALAAGYHDIGFHSRGVLADARRGGLRRDLSLAFSLDETNWRASEFNQEGFTEEVPGPGGQRIRVGYVFAEAVNAFRTFRGPTWDLLRDFHNLAQEVTYQGGVPVLSARPLTPNSRDLGGYEGNATNIFNYAGVSGDPFVEPQISKSSGFGTTTRTVPRPLTTQIAPIISEVRLVFGLQAAPLPPETEGGELRYRLQIVFSPLIVIHNPYNVWLDVPASRIAFRGIPVRFRFTIRETDAEGQTVVTSPQIVDFEDLARSEVSSVSWTDFLRFYLPAIPALAPGSYTVFSARGPVQDFQHSITAQVGKFDDGGFRLSRLRLDTASTDAVTRANSLQPLIVKSSAQVTVTAETGMVNDVTPGPNEPSRKEYSLWLLHLLPRPGETATGGLDDVSQAQELEVNVVKTDSAGPITPEQLRAYMGEPSYSTTVNNLAEISTEFVGPRPLICLGVTVKPHSFTGPGATRPYLTGSPLAPSSRRYPDPNAGPVGILHPWKPTVERPFSWFSVLQNAGERGFFGGESMNPSSTVFMEVPTSPLVSLGQLQHVPMALHGGQPALAFGNSFASPFIARTGVLEQVLVFHADLSYLTNEALWDSYFFSSFARVGSRPPADRVDRFLAGEPPRATRLRLHRASGRSDAEVREALLDHRASASALLVDGAFNVNSTSVAAWTAVLAAHRDLEVPWLGPEGNAGTRSLDGRSALGRFTRPTAADAGTHLSQPAAWGGLASFSDDDLRGLAAAIVSEIRLRGQGRPFGSLGSFANRALASGDTGLKGLLQAAIDASGINNRISSPELVSTDQGSNAVGRFRYPAHGVGPTGSAATANLLQSDLLQALGPILAVRSDTFVIRTYGEIRDPVTDELRGRAWAEAVVQRVPEPVTPGGTDPDDPLSYHNPDPNAPIDFGRQFRIVQFRWLHPDEV